MDLQVLKLIIQVPCYNEETVLSVALSALPRKVPRIDTVEWLVIDDGSEDRTVEIAREHGVDHVIGLPRHEGLARAFLVGLEACLKAGADIIVNTDADNQYYADDIPRLIEPILAGHADIVVGARPIPDMNISRCLRGISNGLAATQCGSSVAPTSPMHLVAFVR